MSTDTFSVAICTFNGGSYLGEQLESIFEQSILPTEIVACDDGSFDDTAAILKRYAEKSPIPFRVLINTLNCGSTLNFSQAIAICKGSVVVLADQDDRWHPEKMARIHDLFRASPDTDLVFSDANLMDSTGRSLDCRLWDAVGFGSALQADVARGAVFEILLRQYVVTGATMAFRSNWKDRFLPIPECWIHDAWIAIVIAALGGKFRAIEDPLISYRQHSTQQIGVQKRTLWEQFQYSRTLDGSFFHRESQKSGQAAARVADIAGGDHQAVGALLGRQSHMRARGLARNKHVAGIPDVIREFITGRYGHYAHGWKAFLTDLAVLTAGPNSCG